MERLLSQGMRGKPQEFEGDAQWLDEQRDQMTGVRLWSETESGERKLLLLGRPGLGLVYVGDIES